MSEESSETEEAAPEESAEAEVSETPSTDLAKLASDFAAALNEDFPALLGVGVTATADPVTSTDATDFEDCGTMVAHPADISGSGLSRVILACEVKVAAMLGALQSGGDAEAAKAALEAGELGEHEAAYGDVSKLSLALLERSAEANGLTGYTAEEMLRVDEPGKGEWLPKGASSRFLIGLEPEGCERVEFHVVLDAAGDAEESSHALVLIDPDGDERDRLEEIGDAKDREISAIDLGDLVEDFYETIGESQAILVAWDLGGRSGLELVEQLVRDPRCEGIPVFLAHGAIKRPMVEAALRAGAAGFVRRPYDLDEVDRLIQSQDR